MTTKADLNHFYIENSRQFCYMKFLVFAVVLFAGMSAKAQKVDSIFFNLYTDSLKKGPYHFNYINVDGKLSNGQWMPLSSKEINFSANAGKFEGNSLILDSSFAGEKVTIKAVLKSNPAISREVTIYVKKVIVQEKLKTVDEILNEPSKRKGKG